LGANQSAGYAVEQQVFGALAHGLGNIVERGVREPGGKPAFGLAKPSGAGRRRKQPTPGCLLPLFCFKTASISLYLKNRHLRLFENTQVTLGSFRH
jgi:hypothetical protein